MQDESDGPTAHQYLMVKAADSVIITGGDFSKLDALPVSAKEVRLMQ